MPTQKLWIKHLRHEDEEPLARRLRALDGVFAAVLNHQDQCAEVDFEDDRVTPDEMRRAIAELGYESEIRG